LGEKEDIFTYMSPLALQLHDTAMMRPKVPKSLDLFNSSPDLCSCPSTANKKRSL